MTEQNVVQHKYVPRPAMVAFHARKERFAVLNLHRRFGKTFAVVNDMVVRAMRTRKRNARYGFVSPYYGMSKNNAWTYFKEAVRNIPGVKISESETSITLPNEAKIRLFGADNPDAIRGQYFDGVVLDEFGSMGSRVYSEVIRPALSDRRGWAVFISTPNGKNKFWEMRNAAIENKSGNWFFLEIKASESGILPQEELDAAREEMDDFEYQQEFEVSFTAAIRGSYYGSHVARLEELGQICDVPVDFDEPVNLAMDIGYADATAIWFWQVIAGQVRVIDYWEESGFDAEETVEVLSNKPYNYETWYIPHDAVNRTFATKKSVLDTFRAADAPARVVPRLEIKDGIDAVRKTLRTYPIVFDKVRCARGIEALRNYSRKWDADRKVYNDKPLHDQWSHGSDGFRYLATVINTQTIQKSLEKVRKKAPIVAPGYVGNVNNKQGLTFNQVWAEHERMLASTQVSGHQRI